MSLPTILFFWWRHWHSFWSATCGFQYHTLYGTLTGLRSTMCLRVSYCWTHTHTHTHIFKLVFAGVFILESLITTVGFFSLSLSKFIGIRSPLYRLLNLLVPSESLFISSFLSICPPLTVCLCASNIFIYFIRPGGDKTELIQSGVFQYVCHPMYTRVFLALWSTPKMVNI